MENPASWDLLTSSLAVSELTQPLKAWAFLVVQGLVRDWPGDREYFCRQAQREYDANRTGQSPAAALAQSLRRQGLALPLGEAEDPEGEMAQERRNLLQDWRNAGPPELRARVEPPLLRRALEAPAEGVRFCYACGRSLPQPVEDKPCPSCTTIPPPEDATFKLCRVCGGPTPPISAFCCCCGEAQGVMRLK